MDGLCENCILHSFLYIPTSQWMLINRRIRHIVLSSCKQLWASIIQHRRKQCAHPDDHSNQYRMWICQTNIICQDKVLRGWYRNDWMLRRMLFGKPSSTRLGRLSWPEPTHIWTRPPGKSRFCAQTWSSSNHITHDLKTGSYADWGRDPAHIHLGDLELQPRQPILHRSFEVGLHITGKAVELTRYIQNPLSNAVPKFSFPVYAYCNGEYKKLFRISTSNIRFLVTGRALPWRSLISIDLVSTIVEHLHKAGLSEFFILQEVPFKIRITERDEFQPNRTLAEQSFKEQYSLSLSDMFSLGITQSKRLTLLFRSERGHSLPLYAASPRSAPHPSLCLWSLSTPPVRHIDTTRLELIWADATKDLPAVFGTLQVFPKHCPTGALFGQMYTPQKHVWVTQLIRWAGSGRYDMNAWPHPRAGAWIRQMKTLMIYLVRFSTMNFLNGEDIVRNLWVALDEKSTRLCCGGRLHPDLRPWTVSIQRLLSLLWCVCASWMLEPVGTQIQLPKTMQKVVRWMAGKGQGLFLSGNKMVQQLKSGRLINIENGQCVDLPLAYPLRRVSVLQNVYDMKPRGISQAPFALCTTFWLK